MKRFKSISVIMALVLGAGAAFSFTDNPACQGATIGYTQPIDEPQYRIPGIKGIDWDCDNTPNITCCWIKTSSGEFVLCYGRPYFINPK